MVMWHSVGSEVHRHASGEGTKALEAISPELLCGIVYHLLLHLINIFMLNFTNGKEGATLMLISDSTPVALASSAAGLISTVLM